LAGVPRITIKISLVCIHIPYFDTIELSNNQQTPINHLSLVAASPFLLIVIIPTKTYVRWNHQLLFPLLSSPLNLGSSIGEGAGCVSTTTGGGIAGEWAVLVVR